MKRLTNKVAIITGGANGIGKATAELFLKEGARVMLVDINEEQLKHTVASFKTKNVAYCVADVSLKEDTIKYVNSTLKKFKGIDVFLNNAGIKGEISPMKYYPEDSLDRVIAVNIKGVFLGCQYVIPEMNKGGSVIITSSIAGLKGFSGMGAYVASKHAAIGLMRVAALENAKRKIRVNSIHPGLVNTSMMRAIESDISPEDPTEAKKGFEATIPFEVYAEAEQIANLVLFLASEESNYVTGTTHVIDGGLTTG